MSGVIAMGEFRNRINVTINDQNYTIIGEDSPEHIRYVAHLVDEKLKEMGRKSTGLDTTRKSILTAVNIMHEKVKLEEENRKLLQEIQQLKQREE
jgi:cell division protein ZapA